MDFSIYVLTIVYLTSSIAAPGNNDRLTLKIHGGSNAPIGKFPSIGYLVDSYGINICGATLISREWAVTAAHCFFGFEPEDPSPGRVVFGNIDAGAVNYNHQESCFEVFIHEDYNDDGLINDIALIQLKKPVDINPFLRPVNVSKTFADTTTYRECYIAGWGATENDVYPDELQFTKVEVFNMSACDNLRDMESYFEDALENEDLWICAGSNTSDACVVDENDMADIYYLCRYDPLREFGCPGRPDGRLLGTASSPFLCGEFGIDLSLNYMKSKKFLDERSIASVEA